MKKQKKLSNEFSRSRDRDQTRTIRKTSRRSSGEVADVKNSENVTNQGDIKIHDNGEIEVVIPASSLLSLPHVDSAVYDFVVRKGDGTVKVLLEGNFSIKSGVTRTLPYTN